MMNSFHNRTDNDDWDWNYDPVQAVNLFDHLLFHHNNEETNDFDHIHQTIENHCDITKCRIFREHYRDKSNDNEYINYREQIWRKIHIFYKHYNMQY